MAERLNGVEAADELARADAWQLAQAQEGWGKLQRGELELAPVDDLARIFREAALRSAVNPARSHASRRAPRPDR